MLKELGLKFFYTKFTINAFSFFIFIFLMHFLLKSENGRDFCIL